MYEILVADDHPLYREAVISVIKQTFPDVVTYEAEDFDAALNVVEEHNQLDLILLDLNMPGMNDLNGLIHLRNEAPEIPVAIISAEEDRDVVLRSVTYGAVGYISKVASSENIGDAIKKMIAGQVYLPSDIIRNKKPSPQAVRNEPQEFDAKQISSLTRRQLLVLERLSKGDSNKQIAYELNIAETTVKTHVSAILSKLHVHNRMQAVLCASKINFDQYLHR
ncbi:LuxR C-terminal-related transcriptional regulator [Porticoccus sp.]